ncbi:hypothetical protein OWO30_14890 [Bacillus safensis]|uniref:hypothetical protein n=1 Tax=Bacillus safensis TaxID=561879 RepID=UPI002271AFDD|nr:hypothetical protein [Bacillus safensis]MCY1119632.1 hypothetical protein [Bacillus safensis]
MDSKNLHNEPLIFYIDCTIEERRAKEESHLFSESPKREEDAGGISSYEYKKNLFIYLTARKAIHIIEWLVLIW